MGVACRGHWPLGTSSAQFTVYRLRHGLTNQDGCPTATGDAINSGKRLIRSRCAWSKEPSLRWGLPDQFRRYDDLLSSGIHDVNKIEDFLDNFISVVVLRF